MILRLRDKTAKKCTKGGAQVANSSTKSGVKWRKDIHKIKIYTMYKYIFICEVRAGKGGGRVDQGTKTLGWLKIGRITGRPTDGGRRVMKECWWCGRERKGERRANYKEELPEEWIRKQIWFGLLISWTYSCTSCLYLLCQYVQQYDYNPISNVLNMNQLLTKMDTCNIQMGRLEWRGKSETFFFRFQ